MGAISSIFSVVQNNFTELFVPTPAVQNVAFYYGPEWIGQQSGPAQIIAFPDRETMIGPEMHFNPPAQPRQLRRALTRILWMIWAPFPPLANWQGSTVVVAGQTTVPSVMNQNGFYFTGTAGTTGGIEPSWPATVGATVVDGTVTWTCTGTTASYSAIKTDNVETIRAALVQAIHAGTVGTYKLLSGEWYSKSVQFGMAGLSYVLTTEFNIPLVDVAEGLATVTSTPLTSIVEATA